MLETKESRVDHISTGTGLSNSTLFTWPKISPTFLFVQKVRMKETRHTRRPRANIPWSLAGLPLRNIRAPMCFHTDSVQVGKLRLAVSQLSYSAITGLRAGLVSTVLRRHVPHTTELEL